MTLEEQIQVLEKEVALLRRLVELEDEKRQLLKRIETAKKAEPSSPILPTCDPKPPFSKWVENRIPCGGDLP